MTEENNTQKQILSPIKSENILNNNKAGILNQARRRPHRPEQRPSSEAGNINLLLKLKTIGDLNKRL